MVATNIGQYYTRKDCRLCRSVNLKLVIDFGLMPHAGDFLTKKSLGKEKYYPLRIFICKECYLLQIIDIVPSSVHFKDYRYLSSVGLSDHFKQFAGKLNLAEGSFIVEIGSNDGVLLKPLQDLGYKVLGVDPAINIAEIAIKKGVHTIINYFNQKTALAIKKTHGLADAIIANNVLAHIDNIDDVFNGLNVLLKSKGVLIFEVHYLPLLIKKLQYDFFYTEHLSYYMLHSLKPYLLRLGFVINDAELIPIHGGSIRVYARKIGKNNAESLRVKQLLKAEISSGLCKIITYNGFAKKITQHKNKLVKILTELKNEGKKVVGYGASGRANTVLNSANISGDLLTYIVDASPERYNRITPGMHIPVLPPEVFRKDNVDYAVLFAWSYKDAILEKEQRFIKNGGKFIIPFPDIQIIP